MKYPLSQKILLLCASLAYAGFLVFFLRANDWGIFICGVLPGVFLLLVLYISAPSERGAAEAETYTDGGGQQPRVHVDSLIDQVAELRERAEQAEQELSVAMKRVYELEGKTAGLSEDRAELECQLEKVRRLLKERRGSASAVMRESSASDVRAEELEVEAGGERTEELEAEAGGERAEELEAEVGGKRGEELETEAGGERGAELETEAGGECEEELETEAGGECAAELEAEAGGERAAELEAEFGSESGAELGTQAGGERAAEVESEFEASILPMKKEDKPERINLAEAADSAARQLQSLTQRAGIRVRLVSSQEAVYINASPGMAEILFKNIIDNAIKYMNREGILQITISEADGEVFVVCKDNGEGLSPQETERVFELNFQGSNRVSGNGLGLAQARAIVEYYGGIIYARSEEGRGMGIYIHMPTGLQEAEE